MPNAALANDAAVSSTPLCRTCSDVQRAALSARLIYSSFGLQSTQAFVGCSLCGLEYDSDALLASIDIQLGRLLRHSEIPWSIDGRLSIEAACHPGYVDIDCIGDFDSSVDRTRELEVLKSESLRSGLADRRLVLVNQEFLVRTPMHSA